MTKKMNFSPKKYNDKKRKCLKKVFILCLAASFTFAPVNNTNAAILPEKNAETAEKLQERVFEEIRTGKITNDEDVIKVAYEQYLERQSKTSGRSTADKDQPVDDSLTITQVLDRKIDENGHIIENALTTNLLVTGENDNIVTASSITNFNSDGSVRFSLYDLNATMNVSVTTDISEHAVRFNWFDTTIYYGLSMKASKLVQASTYSPEPFFVYDDITRQVIEPQGNTSYRYTPSNKEMIKYVRMGTGRTCASWIYVGSRYVALGYNFTCERLNDGNGTWETECQ